MGADMTAESMDCIVRNKLNDKCSDLRPDSAQIPENSFPLHKTAAGNNPAAHYAD